MSDFYLMWPNVTPSLNQWQRFHHRKRTALSQQIKMFVRAAANLHGPHEPKRAVVEVIRYSSGELDHDNLVGGCKPMIDALTAAGLIVDDTPKWLRAVYSQAKAPPRGGRTEVRVSYVAGGFETVTCPTCGAVPTAAQVLGVKQHTTRGDADE